MNKIFFIAILAIFIGCKSDKKTQADDEETVILPPYEIVSVDDISRKNQITAGKDDIEDDKPENYVYVKRVRGKVVLSNSVIHEDLDEIFEKIVSEITEDDPEIDELIIYLYSARELKNKNHDIGLVIWAPEGRLGRVTPKIASQNLRDNYKIVHELYVDDLEAFYKAKETDPLL